MALFGFRSSTNPDYNEDAVRSARAELWRRVHDAKDELDRNPSSASAREALMDAERQLKEL